MVAGKPVYHAVIGQHLSQTDKLTINRRFEH